MSSLSTAACSGVFAHDGSSFSYGLTNEGALFRGLEMAPEGPGYRIPGPWRARQSNFADPAFALSLQQAFADVARLHPGSVAALGDLSKERGGRNPGHQSHQSGRDVDVFFFASEGGKPYAYQDAMLHFSPDGEAIGWSPAKGARLPKKPVPNVVFDVKRNWAFLRSMITNGLVNVQWIFVQRNLCDQLLQEAARQGEGESLVALARALMRQPGDSAPHDDHFHIRVYCNPAHRNFGCVDQMPQRWLKKHWKYMTPPDEVWRSERGPALLSQGIPDMAPGLPVVWPGTSVPRLSSTRNGDASKIQLALAKDNRNPVVGE